MINMAVNILVSIVGAKAIPQGVILLSATPPGVVKVKNVQGIHLKRWLTPLQKVSSLVLVFVHSAINNVPKEISTQRVIS